MKSPAVEEVLQKRFPEAVALIVTKAKNGKVNLCPIGFFSLISSKPRIWSIGLYIKHYSTEILIETKEFVLCLPSIEQAKDVLYSGSVHGWEIDKTKKTTKLKFGPSQFVKPPVVKDSIACFECKVIKHTRVGDHVVFFGGIKAAHESGQSWKEKIYNLGDKKLTTLKEGDRSENITFNPEGSVK